MIHRQCFSFNDIYFILSFCSNRGFRKWNFKNTVAYEKNRIKLSYNSYCTTIPNTHCVSKEVSQLKVQPRQRIFLSYRLIDKPIPTVAKPLFVVCSNKFLHKKPSYYVIYMCAVLMPIWHAIKKRKHPPGCEGLYVYDLSI